LASLSAIRSANPPAAGAVNAPERHLYFVSIHPCCQPACRGSRECPLGPGQCFSARFFDAVLTPEEVENAPSGFRQDPPRPFVLRPGLPPGQTMRGAEWSLDLFCFDLPRLSMPSLLKALEHLGDDGLGGLRAPSAVRSVEGLNENFQPRASIHPIVLPLPVPASSPIETLAVTFLSATEIVSKGQIAKQPDFPLFIHSLGNRLQALTRFYGQGYWPTGELSAFRSHADSAQTRVLRSARVQNARTSTRSGQRHQLTGFTGQVEYLASWRSYSAWLEAGLWTGVGKHTQFGHGTYRLSASIWDSTSFAPSYTTLNT